MRPARRQRASRGGTLSSAPCWLAALVLLALPLTHGALVHAHPAGDAQQLEAASLPGPSHGAAEACPLCLASGQSRALVAASADRSHAGPAPMAFRALLPDDPRPRAAVDLSRAPRAPPAGG